MREMRAYPTVKHKSKRGKVAEGESVRVIAEGKVDKHDLAYAEGFFGMVTDIKDKDTGQTGKTEGVAGDEVMLTIEQAQYETTLIDNGQDYKVGTPVYWDATAGQVTETAQPLLVGKVTRSKAPSGAIWLLLLPQQVETVPGP